MHDRPFYRKLNIPVQAGPDRRGFLIRRIKNWLFVKCLRHLFFLFYPLLDISLFKPPASTNFKAKYFALGGEACTHDNPIESALATVRQRTYRTKSCLPRKTAMAMVFKLCRCAQRKWRELDRSNHLAEIVQGVKFINGNHQDRTVA